MMTEQKDLKAVYENLRSGSLTGAMAAMEIYLASRQKRENMERLFAVKTDFQLMADYWKRGYKDPQLTALYNNLLKRMYMLYANVALSHDIGNSVYLSSVYMQLHLSGRDWSLQTLRDALESYVSEQALLELEPQHRQAGKQLELQQAHHQLMGEWFNRLWLSHAWTDGQASMMEEILLSPTIESRDQQLLVSGLTIAGINHFDMVKLRILLHVYQQSNDEAVRQRALVGWVLMTGDGILSSVYAGERQEIEKLLEDKAVCLELVQLQQQIILCINAEKDNQTIQQEIMPDLLKNSNFRVTRHGLEEIEEDALSDILHPDEEERRMEQVEESFRRMQDMQKQGSDIYFGGFSQMKRFPFFRDIVNWFIPFYMEHPGIRETVEKFKSNRFLQSLLSMGPFCSSDKYSFVLAFSQVVEHVPQNVRDMLEKGEASVGEVLAEESQSAAYIRRTYLQDLYRFYRIFPYRSEFRDAFGLETCIFFAHPVFSKTHLEAYFTDMAAFLIKQKRMKEAGMVLSNCGEARRDFRYDMMAGYLAQHHYCTVPGAGEDGIDGYRHALALQPDHERALLGYAKALFLQQDYEEALACYERLLAMQPEKRGYLLNRAVCLSRMGRYQEAQKDLFRMNYETPDDVQVNRVLAWVLTCDDKYEQAIKIYSRLLSGDVQTEDLLNYGYCLWLSGNTNDAADCFHRFLKETGETAAVILNSERELLMEKGITEPEMEMMLYML